MHNLLEIPVGIQHTIECLLQALYIDDVKSIKFFFESKCITLKCLQNFEIDLILLSAEIGAYKSLKWLIFYFSSHGYSLNPFSENYLKYKIKDKFIMKSLYSFRSEVFPLQFACRNSNLECIDLLILSGADVNIKSDAFGSALHQCILSKNVECLSLLLKNGASISAKNKWNCTALHFAVMKGMKALTNLLIDNKIDINAVDCFKNTSLHYAVLGDDHETCKILIAQNADVTILNEEGNTCIDLANIYNRTKCLKVFADSDLYKI